MTLIICLDLKNGISFNGRRQSRDSAVINRLCSLTYEHELLITPYSENLFPLPHAHITVCEKPLSSKGKLYFCEQAVSESDLENVDKIIVYRWDKVYPQDKSFSVNTDKWSLVSTNKFKGTSHDEIIEEVYIK